MPVPSQYAHRHAHHFTHLENLETILKHGLLCTNEKDRRGISHLEVAFKDIQSRRSAIEIDCGPKGVVHDYVPLYFCKKSPMLYSVVYNKFADEHLIIYLEFPISIIDRLPHVFTNIAANTENGLRFFDDPASLDQLNWEAIDTMKWGQQHDKPGSRFSIKQLKMAELLVKGSIDPQEICQITTFNNSISDIVREIYKDAGLTPPRIVEGDYHDYYIDNTTNRAPVTGPIAIRRIYDTTIKQLIPKLGTGSNPRFADLDELLTALRANFGCLPETAELVGLQSQNEMHKEDVGNHTLLVVKALRKLPEFASMNDVDKRLTEIAAYLHDIGKGPKSRWASTGGKQKVDPDHPIKGLPMVERILTEEVGKVSAAAAKNICKLVCYHDLVGDIVAKGRNPQELEDVAATERQLNMLVAIGKADMGSVNASWGIRYQDDIKVLQKRVSKSLKQDEVDD